MSTTDGLFLVTPDSKIAMTSKLIFFDGIKSLKSSNIFKERMCLGKKEKEIYYHYSFFGFILG